MVKDNIDLVDKEYGFIKKDARLNSNQLRFRPASFSAISNFFRNWRLARLEKKLEKKKKQLLNTEFSVDLNTGGLTRSAERQLNRKSHVIANLEQKIKFLSGEVVSRSFIAARPIKISRNMYSNMVYHADTISASAGEENYDRVFGSEEQIDIPVPVENETVPTIPEVVETAPVVDVVPPTVEQSASVKNAVDDAFGNAQVSTPVQEISPEVVAETVSKGSTTDESDAIDVDSIDGTLSEIDISSDYLGDQAAIQSMADQANNSQIPEIKVSSNESASAKVDHFDSEGQPVVDDVEQSIEIPTVSANDEAATDLESELSTLVNDASREFDKIDNDPENVSIVKESDDTTNAIVPSIPHDLQSALDSYAETVGSLVEDTNVPLRNENLTVSPVADEVVSSLVDSPKESVAASFIPDTSEKRDVHREWTPLTDEQIKEFQEDLANHPVISIDANEQNRVDDSSTVEENEAIRDDVVVVPERDSSVDVNKVELNDGLGETAKQDENEGLHFDYSTATLDDMEAIVANTDSVEGLKKLYEEMVAIRQSSLDKLSDAEKTVQLTKEDRDKRLAVFKDLLCATFEDSKFNDRQREKMQEESQSYVDEIKELDSLMGERATNVRGR